MICPKCKTSRSKEISSKFNKSKNFFERLRKCSKSNCSHIFTTTEKIIQRKIEPRTLWKEYRFEEYAKTLMENVGFKLAQCLKNNKLLERFSTREIFPEIGVNKKGVIIYKIYDLKNNKQKLLLKHTERGLKFLSIRQILKKGSYWEKYKEIFKKEASEDTKGREKDQFAKSINHPETGIASKKYDLDFFKKSQLIQSSKYIRPSFDGFWRIWQKIN